MDTDKVIRRKQLLELIGVSSATQWRMEKAGMFPRRFRVGKGSVGWHLTEVEEWLKTRDRVERQMVERTTVRRATDRALLQSAQTAAVDGMLPGGRRNGEAVGAVLGRGAEEGSLPHAATVRA